MKLDAPETREIDYIQTKKNVIKWFDVEYSKYQRLASLPLLPNNTLSLAPARSTAHANNVEDSTVARTNAKQVLEFINAILDTLDERHKIIIKCRYIQKNDNVASMRNDRIRKITNNVRTQKGLLRVRTNVRHDGRHEPSSIQGHTKITIP